MSAQEMQVRRIGSLSLTNPLKGVEKSKAAIIVGVGGLVLVKDDAAKMLFGAIAVYGLYLSMQKEVKLKEIPVGEAVDLAKCRVITANLGDVLLSAFTSGRCEALQRYYELGDADFVTVFNLFAITYKQSLRDAINALYYTGCEFGTTNYEILVKERLAKI